jgi:hypothetical protein
MKKTTLFLLSLIMISTCMAMDENERAKESRNRPAEVTGLIFHRLNFSYGDEWSKKCRNAKKSYPTCTITISEEGEVKHLSARKSRYAIKI